MKLFKTIDEKFNDINFSKIKENEYGAEYIRNIEKYGYKQILAILHKESGNHIIQSYQEDINSDGFNNVVGLNAIELKLAYKKLHQLSKKYKW